MSQQHIDPWEWQDEFGYSQAVEITDADRVLYCAGQTAMDADGNPVHPDDIRAQTITVLENIEVVLNEAGFDLEDVVQIDCYTTDVDRLIENWDLLSDQFDKPSCTLLGIERLAFPELLVEIKPTAVK
ncbi:RidA family protein [Halocatena halophila]|uniref:RidA family protein n=1 Tax=Halocatena halophila TaxID=2814576 RepID=UPI002ED2093F